MNKYPIFCLIIACVALLSCSEDDDANGLPNGDRAQVTARNVAAVEGFLQELQDKDIDLVARFAADAVVTLKMNPDASQAPANTFTGTGQVTDYFNTIFTRFSRVSLSGIDTSPANDGVTVFAQFNGDFTVAGLGTPYRNVYIARFDFNENGAIDLVDEYLNPVINGQFLGMPLGSCQATICN